MEYERYSVKARNGEVQKFLSSRHLSYNIEYISADDTLSVKVLGQELFKFFKPISFEVDIITYSQSGDVIDMSDDDYFELCLRDDN